MRKFVYAPQLNFSSMASINPSFAVAAAIRADIVTILKARVNPEETAKSISPSLAVINQWATQIPLLLAGPNSGCLDVVFALRKDLFNGPNYIQPSIGLAMEQLPESFHIFINMTREVIALQKPAQKVRFCLPNVIKSFYNFFSLLNALALLNLKPLLTMKRWSYSLTLLTLLLMNRYVRSTSSLICLLLLFRPWFWMTKNRLQRQSLRLLHQSFKILFIRIKRQGKLLNA
jgi:hypothetical protein